MSCCPLWGRGKCQPRTSCSGWVLGAGDSGSAQVSLTIPDAARGSLRLPWPCVPGRRGWAQKREATGGTERKGRWSPYPISLPLPLSPLSFSLFSGLSALVPSAVSSFSAVSLFLPHFTLFTSPLSPNFFSLSLYVPFLSHLFLLLLVFPVLSPSLLSACLSVSLLPPTPSQPQGEEGMDMTYRPPAALGPRLSIPPFSFSP